MCMNVRNVLLLLSEKVTRPERKLHVIVAQIVKTYLWWPYFLCNQNKYVEPYNFYMEDFFLKESEREEAYNHQRRTLTIINTRFCKCYLDNKKKEFP